MKIPRSTLMNNTRVKELYPTYTKEQLIKLIQVTKTATPLPLSENDVELKITNPYTLEERKKLRPIVIHLIDVENGNMGKSEYNDTWGFTGYVMNFEGDDNYSLTPDNVTPSAYILLYKPLEDMPLYINNTDVYVKAIALWRLSVGK